MPTDLCSSQKAEIVLALLKGDLTQEEASTRFEYPPNEIQSWVDTILPNSDAYQSAYERLRRFKRKLKMRVFAGVIASIRFDGSTESISNYDDYWCCSLPLPEPVPGELILYFTKSNPRIFQIEIMHANLCLPSGYLISDEVEQVFDVEANIHQQGRWNSLSIRLSKQPLERLNRGVVVSSLSLPPPMDGKVFAGIPYVEEPVTVDQRLCKIDIWDAHSCLPETFFTITVS